MTDSPPSTIPPGLADFDTLADALVRDHGLTDFHVHYSRSSLTSSRRWEIHASWSATRTAFSARASSPMDCLLLIEEKAKAAAVDA